MYFITIRKPVVERRDNFCPPLLVFVNMVHIIKDLETQLRTVQETNNHIRADHAFNDKDLHLATLNIFLVTAL